MLFAIFCTDKADHLDVRMTTRSAHLDYVKGFLDQIQFGGPTFADDGESMNGSLLVVDFKNRSEVDIFAANDPYAQAGLFETVVIRAWKKVLP